MSECKNVAIGQIVAAYVDSQYHDLSTLEEVIVRVRKAFEVNLTEPVVEPVIAEIKSAREIKASVKPHALVSFIDGKEYKSLKRHITRYGLTPDSYRQKFGLGADYPMVSPEYSKSRSELARRMGLGRTPNRFPQD